MNIYVYVINVIVCISVIIFCGMKVMMDPRPETTSIYLPIMSGIVGYFVPNPALKKKEENKNIINASNVSQLSNGSQQSGSNPPPTPPLSPANISISGGYAPAGALSPIAPLHRIDV
jgi:hypothetical protein